MATICTETWISQTGKGLEVVGAGTGVFGGIIGYAVAKAINAVVPDNLKVNEIVYGLTGLAFFGSIPLVLGYAMDTYGKECK